MSFQVCGICGNWDGNKENDLFPRGSNQKGTYQEIGESYLTQIPVIDDTDDEDSNEQYVLIF